MPSEYQQIENLFNKLRGEEPHPFPESGKSVKKPIEHGVYIIREKIRRRERVLHVGRTLDGKEGLRQRLTNHLYGSSSFVQNSWFNGDGSKLREDGYTYQYLIVEDDRKRVLLEAYTTGRLCPEYVGLGKKKTKRS